MSKRRILSPEDRAKRTLALKYEVPMMVKNTEGVINTIKNRQHSSNRCRKIKPSMPKMPWTA